MVAKDPAILSGRPDRLPWSRNSGPGRSETTELRKAGAADCRSSSGRRATERSWLACGGRDAPLWCATPSKNAVRPRTHTAGDQPQEVPPPPGLPEPVPPACRVRGERCLRSCDHSVTTASRGGSREGGSVASSSSAPRVLIAPLTNRALQISRTDLAIPVDPSVNVHYTAHAGASPCTRAVTPETARG